MAVDTQIDEKVSIKVEPPKMWKVVFLNDDHTPMEFVIELLVSIFRHTESKAKDLTLEIHNSGSAVAGVYSHEIAEQRGMEATHLSRANGFPLQVQLEQDS
jgi:ATP-dependent Clp protease adaptor protein ClpS